MTPEIISRKKSDMTHPSHDHTDNADDELDDEPDVEDDGEAEPRCCEAHLNGWILS
jgi:hypothetical protein